MFVPLLRGRSLSDLMRGRARPPCTLIRLFGSRRDFFKVSEEVIDALETHKPVVALETTIYTHGFPYPQNIALASHLESLVRVNGGVPATIGVLDGVARVGMQAEELIKLISTAGNPDTMKVSRRDLGYILGLGLSGKKLNAGTTIAATMILAHLAGIKVFATGGLGGVHRGGDHSLDISADLTELGRTPVAVISAGCKSFLDLPRTLEYLETQGVGVATFSDGRDGPVDLPAFYVRNSGIQSPRTVKDEYEAAAIIYAQSQLPVHSGIWFAGPVPATESLTKAEVDEWVALALSEAESDGIYGAASTPYVLDKINRLSGGRSIVANKAGIAANVIRGTKVAVELEKLRRREEPIRELKEERDKTDTSVHSQDIGHPKTAGVTASLSVADARGYDILVAGSLATDLMCDYAPLEGFEERTAPIPHTSNPATFSQSAGGVGHNIALAAHYAGASTLLCSFVGNDTPGRALLEQVQQSGLPISGIQTSDALSDTRTAQYVGINDKKRDLVIAMADMSIFSSTHVDSASIWQGFMTRHHPRWVVIDANWSESVISKILTAARTVGARIAFDPVSTEKSSRFIGLLKEHTIWPNHIIDLAAPNVLELQTMYSIAKEKLLFESEPWWQIINQLNLSRSESQDCLARITSPELISQGIPQQNIQLLPYMPSILTKLGAKGCLLSQLLPPEDPRLRDPTMAPYILGKDTQDEPNDTSAGGIFMRLFPPSEVVQQSEIVSVNGVGDTLLGVLVAALSRVAAGGTVHARSQPYVEDVLMMAQQAAVHTLRDTQAVSDRIKGILA